MSNIIQFRDSVGSGNTFGSQGAATALALNAARTGFQIQNLATDALYVKFGPTASSTSYSFILKGGTGAADGSGGSFAMFGPEVWRGIVTVASSTTAAYVALEL